MHFFLWLANQSKHKSSPYRIFQLLGAYAHPSKIFFKSQREKGMTPLIFFLGLFAVPLMWIQIFCGKFFKWQGVARRFLQSGFCSYNNDTPVSNFSLSWSRSGRRSISDLDFFEVDRLPILSLLYAIQKAVRADLRKRIFLRLT